MRNDAQRLADVLAAASAIAAHLQRGSLTDGWPPDLQEYADDLVNALTVRADVFRQCSQLGTTYFDQKPIFAQQDDAYRMVANTREFLRRKLRLPSR